MSGGISQYAYYASLFKNPISISQSNPISDQMFGAAITAKYTNTLNSTFSREASSYLQSSSSDINQIKSSGFKLQNSFSTKAITVSNPKVAIAQVATPSAEKKEYTVKVDAIATAQINTSNALASSKTSDFSVGMNTFKIQTATKSYQINVNVKSYHTNKDVLKAVNDQINQSNSGFSSQLTNTKNGNSYLTISSKDIGEKNNFQIKDVSGNLAEQAGFNQVSQTAGDAKYSIDGKAYTADSNAVKLQGGKVNLNLTSVGETKIKVEQNSNQIESYLSNDNFNGSQSFYNYSSSASKLGLSQTATQGLLFDMKL